MSQSSPGALLAAAMPLLLAVAPVMAPAQERRYSPADVEFMQGMIGHHAQALAMAAKDRLSWVKKDLKQAEKENGAKQAEALTQLATALEQDAQGRRTPRG